MLEGWSTTLAGRQFDAQAIITLYEGHGAHEQFHSEFKTDLDLERLPSGKFDTNALVCALAALAMNILRLLGQAGLHGPDAPVRHEAKRRRIKTVMQELIYRAARLIDHGRRRILGLGANDRSAQAFARCTASLRWLAAAKHAASTSRIAQIASSARLRRGPQHGPAATARSQPVQSQSSTQRDKLARLHTCLRTLSTTSIKLGTRPNCPPSCRVAHGIYVGNRHPRHWPGWCPTTLRWSRWSRNHEAAARGPRHARHLQRQDRPSHQPGRAVVGGNWGYTARPGTMTHWPGGLALAFPAAGSVSNRLVLAGRRQPSPSNAPSNGPHPPI